MLDSSKFLENKTLLHCSTGLGYAGRRGQIILVYEVIVMFLHSEARVHR